MVNRNINYWVIMIHYPVILQKLSTFKPWNDIEFVLKLTWDFDLLMKP